MKGEQASPQLQCKVESAGRGCIARGRMRPSPTDSAFRSAASEPMRFDCRSRSSSRVARFLESES